VSCRGRSSEHLTLLASYPENVDETGGRSLLQSKMGGRPSQVGLAARLPVSPRKSLFRTGRRNAHVSYPQSRGLEMKVLPNPVVSRPVDFVQEIRLAG